MDHSPLVREEIDGGMKLVEAFEASYPVLVAFWLKRDEESSWDLYIASDRFEHGKMREAYMAVVLAAREVGESDLIPFRLKLVTADDPLARAALDLCEQFPSLLPIRLGSQPFGDRFVDGGYIYPPPAHAAKT